MNKWIVIPLLATLSAVGGHWSAQAADGESRSMEALSWLAGVWESQPRDGAQSEYVYMPLFNGVMVSTDVTVKEGQPTRYELRVIKDENGQVVFRELGFKPDLSSAGPVPARPLQSADSKQLDFTDMQLTRTGPNTATMELTIHPPGGAAPRTVTMQLHRVFRFAKVG